MDSVDNGHRRADLLESTKRRFGIEPRVETDGSIWVSTEEGELGDLLAFLKGSGFGHCSAISVTDWPEDGAFELTYHLWSYEAKTLLTVKSRIGREDATVDSAVPYWGPSAGIHERELHELFGVSFRGNADLAPLFLESWEGPPPFRRDFDWRAYVREAFYDEGDPRDRSYWD